MVVEGHNAGWSKADYKMVQCYLNTLHNEPLAKVNFQMTQIIAFVFLTSENKRAKMALDRSPEFLRGP